MPSLTQRLGVQRYEADQEYKEALVAMQKRDRKAAIARLNEAIRLLPTNAEYWAARGLMYYEEGTDDLAKADFERALKAYKYEMLAHYGLGLIALRDDLPQNAITHLEDAFKLDPERPETMYALALAHDQANNATDALAWMQRAHDRFDALGDKRRNDAVRWLSTLRRKAR
jgi:beta-barrel assembly-enhancing protease